MSAEKTEQATEQRKKKSREKGDVVHSRELVSATAMLAGLILLGSAAQRFVLLWRNSYNGTVAASLHSYITPEEMLGTCGRVLLPAMEPLLLVMAAALAGALATGVAQSGGLQVRVEALAWKPARLNPLSNAKQMFSARSALRLGKSLLPAAAVIAIALHLLRNLMLTMPVMSGARLPETLSGSYQLALDAAWISVGWSGLDYLIEWRSWNQRLKIGRWQTEGECLLAVNTDPRARALPGVETREPAFNVLARWIQPGLEEQALASGYSVVDQSAVIGTHLTELIRRHAHELLGRAETKRLLDTLNESHPKLVEELVPKLLSLGEVQKVLQQLLREQVSIRNLGTILETLVECAGQNKNLVFLTEQVRQALGRGLVRPLLDGDGGLPVLVLDRAMEEEILYTFDPEGARRLLGDGGPRKPASAQIFLRQLLESVKRLTGEGEASALPVLLCPSPARFHLRRWLEPFLPKVTVLAPTEIPPEIRVRSLGTVGQ